MDQSSSHFETIKGSKFKGSIASHAIFALAGASECDLIEDAEKHSYRCVWVHPLGAPEAQAQFQQLTTDIDNCISGLAEQRTDQPVNHPDIFKSHYYTLPHGALSISLKNKSQLKSTIITIRVDSNK